jgi:hypothetical protein
MSWTILHSCWRRESFYFGCSLRNQKSDIVTSSVVLRKGGGVVGRTHYMETKPPLKFSWNLVLKFVKLTDEACDVQENQLSDCHTLGCQWISVILLDVSEFPPPIVRTSWPIWVKFGIGDLHTVPLSSWEVRGSRCSENHIRKGVNEAFAIQSTSILLIWMQLGTKYTHKMYYAIMDLMNIGSLEVVLRA